MFPIFVILPPCLVPGLILTYSLNLLLLPITIEFFSPLYFKSCGSVPIETNGKISLPSPIVVFPIIFICENNRYSVHTNINVRTKTSNFQNKVKSNPARSHFGSCFANCLMVTGLGSSGLIAYFVDLPVGLE